MLGYFGEKSCGWAAFCCCFGALQWPSCLLNESSVIPFILLCSSANQPRKYELVPTRFLSSSLFLWFFSLSIFVCSLLHLFEGFSTLAVRSVETSVIDRTMCHGGGECCSWRYIICNFRWVNIAGSLVKQRDKLFWERKCCLSFLKARKKNSFNSWKI